MHQSISVKSVMIIDDEVDLVDLVKEVLREFGCECEGFTDAAQALAFYAEHWKNIDLVLTDMTMPGFTAAKVLQELRRCNPNVKAILVSGNSEIADNISQVHAEGYAGFLAKPFRDEELLRILR